MSEEKAILVDKHDNVLEYRVRSKVGNFDLHRIVGVWITNNKGQVLLAQRAHTMHNQPGLWGPAAAGTVAAGETYASTAKRELAEEIGLKGVELTKTGKFMTDKDFGESRMCVVFVGHYHGPLSALRLQKEEVAAVRWTDLLELTHDVANNPKKYVINMKQVIDCLP